MGNNMRNDMGNDRGNDMRDYIRSYIMKRIIKGLFGTILVFTAVIASSSATHKSLLIHSSKNQTPIKISEKWIPKGYWSKRFVDPTREVCSSPRANIVHTAGITLTNRKIQCAYF